MNDPVFICDICSVALPSNFILPEYNWTEFTTQDALHVMLVYVFMAIGEKQGREENWDISQYRQIQRLTEVTLKCTVNVLRCRVSLEGAWVEMYNVLCISKETIILSCGSALEKTHETSLHKECITLHNDC